MARGWESKAVEAQIEAAESRRARAPQMTATPDEIRARQERESLEMALARVMKDLESATHPRYRAQLESALQHLENRLKQVDPM